MKSLYLLTIVLFCFKLANIVAWDWWLLLLPTIVALVLSGVAEAFRNIRKP